MAANSNGSDEDEEVICRICHLSEEEMKESLIKVCLCRGSLEFVHQSCIGKWVQLSKQLLCVCGYRLSTRLEKHPSKLTIKERFKKSLKELTSVEELRVVGRVSRDALLMMFITYAIIIGYHVSSLFFIPKDVLVQVFMRWMFFGYQTCRIRELLPYLILYLIFICFLNILPVAYILCIKMLTKMWHKRYNYKLTVETIA